MDELFAAVFERADELGLIDERPEGAVDATGLESRYVSAHYVNRRKESGAFVQRHWPKLTVVCHVKTYLFAGAVMSRGPSNDVAFFKPAMTQAAEHIALTAYSRTRHMTPNTPINAAETNWEFVPPSFH